MKSFFGPLTAHSRCTRLIFANFSCLGSEFFLMLQLESGDFTMNKCAVILAACLIVCIVVDTQVNTVIIINMKCLL